MIVHISMARYKESAGGRSKQENIERGRHLTETLPQHIPTIKRIEVGLNIFHGPNDCDVVSYSEYENMEAVKATTSHPAHDELVAFLKEVTEVSYTVTYEVTR
jgi:Stress responsive A/B Barrel Domain